MVQFFSEEPTNAGCSFQTTYPSAGIIKLMVSLAAALVFLTLKGRGNSLYVVQLTLTSQNWLSQTTSKFIQLPSLQLA